MNALLQELVTLQRLDNDIRTSGHDLQQVPKKSKLIDDKVQAVKGPFEQALAEREALAQERSDLEKAVIALEEKERQLKLKVPGVRSNEEYSALLKEMDNAKKEKDRSEERILAILDRLEAMEKELPELEKAYQQGEEKVAEERGALSREQDALSNRLLELKKERQALQASMNAGWFRRYTHIAAQRNGLAVAEVRTGICQGCFVGVRPKVIQDLKIDEEIHTCEGCQRILFLVEER